MRNKSRKRILHEQRVKIASMERQLRKLRQESVIYDPEIIEARVLMSPHTRPEHYNDILKMECEKMCRNMIEKLLYSGAVEITKTREPTYNGYADCYRYTLRVLRRRR